MVAVGKYAERKNLMGNKRLDIDSQRYADVKYKRIEVDNHQNQEITVPLEEAMLINDKAIRRSMMLDILKQNADDYVELLQRARLSDDTELTHYATTTMMEIQSQYELRLHELAQSYETGHGDSNVLKSYSRELSKYIDSGLISGNILRIYRLRLGEVLERITKENPESMKYRLQQCYNLLELEEYGEVEKKLGQIKKRWPQEEKVYRLCGEYYRRTLQGDKFYKMLNNIEKKNIYLSNDGKQWLHFWKDTEDKNEEVPD